MNRCETILPVIYGFAAGIWATGALVAVIRGGAWPAAIMSAGAVMLLSGAVFAARVMGRDQ